MHARRTVLASLLATGLVLASAAAVFAQLQFPRPSPKATVSQTVGLTEMSIAYCRPSVRGRVIWGGLVPYDQVWRTGANEATTITFGDEVAIDGHPLSAGTYAIFTIPGKEEWTVIFNKGVKLWGAYEYKQEEDVLRIKVKPQPAEYLESMTFSFRNLATESAEVALNWENLRVSFTVKVDTINKVLPAARKSIAEAAVDDWRTPLRVASFCIDNNVNLEEAGAWLERSIAVNQNYYNLSAKAKLLALGGRKAEAIALAKKAVELGKAAETKADTGPTERLIAEWEAQK